MENVNGLQERIDQALQAEQDSRSGIGSGKWKPSMLGRCYRAHYWARADEPRTNPPDARALRVFKAGHLFHDFAQGFFPLDQKEIKVENEDILGFADLVGEDIVRDIKSQHSRAFWYMQKKNCDIKKEKFTNWLQVAVYGKILNKPRISLVFISKDDLTIAEYVDFTNNWIETVDNEIRRLITR